MTTSEKHPEGNSYGDFGINAKKIEKYPRQTPGVGRNSGIAISNQNSSHTRKNITIRVDVF